MEKTIKDLCDIITDKIEINQLINKNLVSNYISTENMLSNKAGICPPSTIPNSGKVTFYQNGDVLVSNIRPYFKKIWQANRIGGCSNDVLVFRANNNTDKDFLYYTLTNDNFFEYATATAKGTKMPRGDKTAIMNYHVTSFPINIQKKISSVLKPIDDKIALNNAINYNLVA